MRILIEIDEKDLEKVKAVIGEETPAEAPKKADKKPDIKPVKGTKAVAEEDGEPAAAGDYEGMSSKALYALCCERGISSKCKKRDKASLIAVLKENDNAAAPEEEDDEAWPDEDPEPENDPYAGKTVKELYKMCVDQGIEVKPRLSAEEYIKALKEADDWNI